MTENTEKINNIPVEDIPLHMLKHQPERTMLIVRKVILEEQIKEKQAELKTVQKELGNSDSIMEGVY